MKKPIKIFIIDDDSIFVFLTKKTIVRTGVETEFEVFEDGEKSILHLKSIADNVEKLPDIIFLDLNMPVLDGWEFLEEFKLLEPTLPKRISTYLVSSSISPHDIERSKNYSLVKDFLIKPLEIDQLKDLFELT
ncbi:MAG: response regulator [Bacteroidetes bacterium]|nr:response regulator [Bacteroidota bacterium]